MPQRQKGGERMKKRIKGMLLGLTFCLIGTTPSFGATYIMHTVQPNETLFKIATANNVSVSELKQMNSLNGDEIHAGTVFRLRPAEKKISVFVNGQQLAFDAEPYLENNRTFVPIRKIGEALQTDEISWDNRYQQAVLIKNGMTLRLPVGSKTVFKDTMALDLEAPITTYQSRTFVPLRFISEAFDCDVEWDARTYSIHIYSDDIVPPVSTIVPPSPPSYTDEDLYWLSRIVEAEAKGEPYEGKLAVANCVINRKKSPDFPNTIKGVIFDRNYGYQYTPAANGTIYNTPSQESIEAAKSALSGNNNIGNSLYFLNPKKATNFWIIRNRTFYRRIQNHDFYL